MKAKDFGMWLAALSEGLSPSDRARSVSAVHRIFDGRGTRTVATVLKAGEPERVSGGMFGARVADLHDTLNAFMPFVVPAAKKAYVDDLKAFIGFLARYRDARLESFVDAVCAQLEKGPTKPKRTPVPLRQAVVDQYVSELRAAHTHGEAFREVFQRLEKDRKVRALEAAAIANGFAFQTAKSTPKKESLRRIWRRQEVYERAGERFGPKQPAA